MPRPFNTAVEGTMLPGQTKLFSPVTMLSDAQTTYDVGTASEYTPQQLSKASITATSRRATH